MTDIRPWEEIGRVHAGMLGDVRPATTMVEVSALADPAALVEVEADAVLNPHVGTDVPPGVQYTKAGSCGLGLPRKALAVAHT